MKSQISGNAHKVYKYLLSIYPRGATNSEIESATLVHPHQQVFQITQRLTKLGYLRAERSRSREREWIFFAQSKEIGKDIGTAQSGGVLPTQATSVLATSPADFESLAAAALSKFYGVPLGKGGVAGIPKQFDLVAADGSVIGDAKYFTLVGGQRLPPAKFSVIAEHVWLLEKTQARYKFLVFGNQREVPIRWLEKFGHLIQGVKFFFLDNEGKLEELN